MSKTEVEIELENEQGNKFQICENEIEYQRNESCEEDLNNESSVYDISTRQLRDRSKHKQIDFYGNPIAMLIYAEPIIMRK